MNKTNPKKSFYNDYKPCIVMIPAIVALHFIWFKIQQNEKLVPKGEQLTEQPLVTVSARNMFPKKFFSRESIFLFQFRFPRSYIENFLRAIK